MMIGRKDLNKVLKEPTLENFRALLQNHMGEEDYLDFKKEWESNEKTSKHILAMENKKFQILYREKIDYVSDLKELKKCFIKSKSDDEGNNRNNVIHGYMHPRFWDKETFIFIS